MSHPSKDGVDKFMSHIQKAVNLRAEAERLAHRHWHIRVKGVELRKESEKMIRDAEYMVYELIDNAIGEVDYSLGQGEHWVPVFSDPTDEEWSEFYDSIKKLIQEYERNLQGEQQ